MRMTPSGSASRQVPRGQVPNLARGTCAWTAAGASAAPGARPSALEAVVRARLALEAALVRAALLVGLALVLVDAAAHSAVVAAARRGRARPLVVGDAAAHGARLVGGRHAPVGRAAVVAIGDAVVVAIGHAVVAVRVGACAGHAGEALTLVVGDQLVVGHAALVHRRALLVQAGVGTLALGLLLGHARLVLGAVGTLLALPGLGAVALGLRGAATLELAHALALSSTSAHAGDHQRQRDQNDRDDDDGNDGSGRHWKGPPNSGRFLEASRRECPSKRTSAFRSSGAFDVFGRHARTRGGGGACSRRRRRGHGANRSRHGRR